MGARSKLRHPSLKRFTTMMSLRGCAPALYFDAVVPARQVRYSCLFRSDWLALAISFMLLGCAVNPYASRAGLAIQRVFSDKDDDLLTIIRFYYCSIFRGFTA
jgi:hypothetical protein